MMMLLTRHAEGRLVKRLAKRRRIDRVYSRLWDFLDRSKRIEVNEKIVIFTDGQKSLVCVRLPCERLSLEDIRDAVSGLKDQYRCVFWNGRAVRETIPKKFLEDIPSGRYCFYLNREKRSLYLGSREPLLAITFRPAKRGEREKVKRGIGITISW